MRLAFLTPLPPSPSGIADYSIDVLRLLASRHEVDVFHGPGEVDRGTVPAGCRLEAAGGFLTRYRERPHDLAVYQMGNGPAHDFLYDLLPRVPGLLVLHDLVLHHARARVFLDSPAARAHARAPGDPSLRAAAEADLARYRAELAHSHPAVAERLAEVHLGTVGRLLPYAYPLFRLPVESSRATAVHNAAMRDAVVEEVPEAVAVRVAMPMEAPPPDPEAAARCRARLGFSPEDVVVGCFGLLTPEKQLETVARAVARAAAGLPRLRLLLVGGVPDPARLQQLLGSLDVTSRAAVAGRVPLADLPAHVEAADVVAHLRYPTARETSAALLRVLAQGRPTVMSDLENLSDVPEDAVVRLDPTDEEGGLTRALLGLAASPEARGRLSAAARRHVANAHSPRRCLDSYEAAFAAALAAPPPCPRSLPAHWPRPV